MNEEVVIEAGVIGVNSPPISVLKAKDDASCNEEDTVIIIDPLFKGKPNEFIHELVRIFRILYDSGKILDANHWIGHQWLSFEEQYLPLLMSRTPKNESGETFWRKVSN